MKILVISQDSTSMKKKMKFPPSCDDLLPSKIPIYKALHNEYMNKAINMFVDTQHKKVVRGVNFLKRILGKDNVDFYILSAGFGLIPAEESIIPYSCSFDDMAVQEIMDRSKILEIPKTLKNILENNKYALVFYILNKNYLLSLNKAPAKTQAISVFFVDTDIPCKRKVVLTYSNELVSGYFASGIKLGGSVAYKGGLFLAFSKALFSEKDPVGMLQKVSKTVNSFLKYMTASNIAPKLERAKMKLAEIQASEEKKKVTKAPPESVAVKPSSTPVVSAKVSASKKKSRKPSAKVSVSKPKKEAKEAVKKEKPKKEAKEAVKKEKPKKEAKEAVKKEKPKKTKLEKGAKAEKKKKTTKPKKETQEIVELTKAKQKETKKKKKKQRTDATPKQKKEPSEQKPLKQAPPSPEGTGKEKNLLKESPKEKEKEAKVKKKRKKRSAEKEEEEFTEEDEKLLAYLEEALSLEPKSTSTKKGQPKKEKEKTTKRKSGKKKRVSTTIEEFIKE